MRLGTLLLLVVALALVFGLFLQKRRERDLQATLLPYRDQVAEGILAALDRPLVLTYADRATLKDALENLRLCSTGQPKLPKGITIYVDTYGLASADRTLTSTIKRPPRDANLSVREHLDRILKPLGLGITLRGGWLIITSEDAAARQPSEDPYLGYRDVLR